MFLIKIHKWLLGLAIIASVTSFSGYTVITDLVCYENTEWVSLENPVDHVTNYYFNNALQSTHLIKELYLFEFKFLLETYNSAVSLKFKTSNYKALQCFEELYFEVLINTGTTDDHNDIFIG